MKEVKVILDNIINELVDIKKEYSKLEHNLYDTQLRFDFGEGDGEIKLNVLRQEN